MVFVAVLAARLLRETIDPKRSAARQLVDQPLLFLFERGQKASRTMRRDLQRLRGCHRGDEWLADQQVGKRTQMRILPPRRNRFMQPAVHAEEAGV